MSEPNNQIICTEKAEIREDIINVVTDGSCPTCRTTLEFGYGLAGGGCGTYEYCPKCQQIVSKTQDPEE